MVELDKWAVSRAHAIQAEIVKAYEAYDLLVVTQKLMQFCSIEMGSFYLDIIKDRQYTAKSDSHARRSCQSALYHIVEALVRWMAPITSFTAQEIWQEMPWQEEEFVFTGTWYTGLSAQSQNTQFNDAFWQQVLAVKDEVNRRIELARKEGTIGGSLEAEVKIYATPELADLLAKLKDEARFVFITSSASVESLESKPADATETEVPGLWLHISASEGEKCARCWHHREDVGTNEAHPELCQRCVTNVDGEGETRAYA